MPKSEQQQQKQFFSSAGFDYYYYNNDSSNNCSITYGSSSDDDYYNSKNNNLEDSYWDHHHYGKKKDENNKIRNKDENRKKERGEEYLKKKGRTKTAATIEPTRDSRRILLIDDEKDIVDVFKFGLELKGFEVDAYTDPFEALFNFKAGYYDIVISDVRMPGMSGFELCEALLKRDGNINKIFFVSAFQIYMDKLRLQYPNIITTYKQFIDKPVSIDKLVEIIITA